MHTANLEIRECVKWSLKNNSKSLTFRPKKWSWSLTGGGRLLGVSTVRLRLVAQFSLLAGESLILWEIDGRLREVVTHGCSTVNHEEF